MSNYFKILYFYVKIIVGECNMPRIDMLVDYLIEDINYAKRTLTLQDAFNKIR